MNAKQLRFFLLSLACGLMALQITDSAHARGNDGWSLGGNFNFISSSQDDIDQLITAANTSAGGITTSNLGSAYEFTGFFNYRFKSSMMALSFRPSYYTNSTTGTGAGGDYDYKLSGFTFFPMFRIYLLENKMIRFFTNAGVGWGQLNGEITEGSASVAFSGNSTGFMGGLGVEFCFWDNHCINMEANYRLLGIDRNVSSRSSGTFNTAGGSLSQWQDGEEVEIGGRDLSTTLSGFMSAIGYIFYF